MNRLRSHFAIQVSQKPQRRLQSEIVAHYREDIVGLIADDGATLTEVAAAVRAEGEPVLDPGFKAAILKTIGTVKNIRAGRVKAAAVGRGSLAAQPPSPPSTPVINSSETPLDDDDDDAFAARPPRR